MEIAHPLFEVLDLPYWVSWRSRTIGSRTLKIPIDPQGRAAKVNERGWKFTEVPPAHGFILSPDHAYAVIDLDWKGADVVPDWAQQLMSRLKTYTEVSPSGKGAHLWVKVADAKPQNQVWKTPEGEVNLLSLHRYATVTWQSFNGVLPIKQVSSQELIQLIAPPDPLWQQVISESQLIRSLLEGQLPQQFQTTSQSELDWAVARELARFTRDPEVIRSLFFRIPALVREKLEREDYLTRTIQKALHEGEGPSEFRLISATELIKTPPPPEGVATGLLSVGLTILAGRPKLGKTWLALQIARSVASGEPALGLFPTKPGKVIYLALEDTPWRMSDRLQKLGPISESLYFVFEPLTLSQAERLLEQEGPVLLVIDTLLAATKATGDGLSRVKAEYDELQSLSKAASRMGAAVVVVTHTAKAERSFSLDRVLGTTGVTAAVDSVVTLSPSPTSEGALLESKARDYPPLELTLTWVEGWQVSDDSDVSPRQQILLELANGPKTSKALAGVLSLSPKKARRILNEMVAAGLIEKRGIAYWRKGESDDEGSDS